MKTAGFTALAVAAATSAHASYLNIIICITSDGEGEISAEYSGPNFPTDNFSAVNAFDFRISGLTSFATPIFDNAFLPGVLPESDPLAAPFGGIDLDTGVVNWFVQAPTNIAPTTGSWTGAVHQIGTFTFDGLFEIEGYNLSGAFENPGNPVIGTSSVDYVVSGDDTGVPYSTFKPPAPGTAGAVLAGAAMFARRRR